MVNVTYGSQRAKLPIIVIHAEKYAPPLLGRNWLHAFQLDWKALFGTPSGGTYTYMKRTSLQDLKSQYQDIFSDQLGTAQGVKARLHLRENVKPIFHKARSVPYALRPAVEKELQRMQDQGIIKPVEISDWATPLVCVPKADGSVRLCGDCKVTVNQVIQTDQHPIPTAEEICSKLAGRQKFSKIDLKCAYQQMMLDEESQELVTVNTHKGLFQYTRLPFGISSSPAIWQRFIDQVLSGLNNVCVIQDDVLVTGRDDEEHLYALDQVFQIFTK